MICRFCKQQIPKGTEYKNSPNDRSYYCNVEHWRLSQEKKLYKPKKVTNDGNINPRRQLLDYIQELYVNQGYEKHTINWKLITAVLKNQMEENKDMTLGGIQYTLWYCKEIKQLDLFGDKSNTVLWCVPFNYSEAQDYYLQTAELEDAINNFEFNETSIIVKKSINKPSKKFKKISIDDLV